jgi:large subunit ribosomal protein L5
MTTAEAKKTPSLQAKYGQEVVADLKKQFGIKNDLAVPTLQKIIINMGVNGAVENKTRVEIAAKDMGTIAGQKPTIRNARKSISGFKLR